MFLETNEAGCKVIIEQCRKNIKDIDKKLEEHRQNLPNASSADVDLISAAINRIEQEKKQQEAQIEKNEEMLRSLKP
jgi:hypothetical protein